MKVKLVLQVNMQLGIAVMCISVCFGTKHLEPWDGHCG